MVTFLVDTSLKVCLLEMLRTSVDDLLGFDSKESHRMGELRVLNPHEQRVLEEAADLSDLAFHQRVSVADLNDCASSQDIVLLIYCDA